MSELKQATLPPECAATLEEIARGSAEVIAESEATFGMTLPPEARARLLDHCFDFQTRQAAAKLRGFNRPFHAGADLN